MMQMSGPRTGVLGKGGLVFAAALVAWVVALLGDRMLGGVKQVVLGKPEYRALTEAMDVAMTSVLEDCPAQSRTVLNDALHERFSELPAVTYDGRTRVRTGIRRGIQLQLAPLADPGITPSGVSFLDEIGVDAAVLREELADVVIRSIEQVGTGSPALTPLVNQLNADAIVERVDLVLQEIGRARDRSGSARAGASRTAAAAANRKPATDISPDVIERLTDALLDIPAIADAEARSTVLAMLPRRLRRAIPHSRYPRIQVLEMIRTCKQHDRDGLRDLVRAVRLVEGDSPAMEELDELIVSLDNSDCGIGYLPGGGHD
jgi:hypothetical protein